MRTFNEFRNEVLSGKLKNVYYVAASDSYFVSKAGDILREKLFGSAANRDNFFLRYADDTSVQDVSDLASNFASLFASEKVIIVKRCEKYSRKMAEFLEITESIGKKDKSTFLMLVFDPAFVADKKLDDKREFYDFSDLPQKDLYDWVRSEFEERDIAVQNDALDLFVTSIPRSFDLLSSEIEKVSNFEFEGSDRTLTKEIILQFIGYDREASPDELVLAIAKKDRNRAFSVLDNLLNSKGMNEVYLLSMISGFYMDIISFKTRGLDSMDSRMLFQKYKMWGDRAKIAKNCHKSMDLQSLHKSFGRLIDTDKKLKSSQVDPKILMISLVQDLINA